MKVYEFGERTKPLLLLMPGDSGDARLDFKEVIEALSSDFCLACVSYTGFEDEQERFLSALDEVKRVEYHVNQEYGGHIEAAAGFGAGGKLVLALIARRAVHVRHGILFDTNLKKHGSYISMLHALITLMITGKKAAPKEKRKLFLYTQGIMQFEDGISVPGTLIHVTASSFFGKRLSLYHKLIKEPDLVETEKTAGELMRQDPRAFSALLLSLTAKALPCMEVTEDTLIGDLLAYDKELASVLLKSGMHCAGCPSQAGESLLQACAVHHIPVEQVLSDLRSYLSENYA